MDRLIKAIMHVIEMCQIIVRSKLQAENASQLGLCSVQYPTV